MTREERSEVYMNTISAIKNLGYEVNKKFIPLKGAKKLKENSVFYPKLSKLPDTDVKFETKIYVENIDCLVKAKEFGENGILLNMASRKKPGGGVFSGSAAQEEDIFRRSNLGVSLYQFHQDYKDIYMIGEDKNIEGYPITSEISGIYSPGVTVFRDISDNDYDFLEDQYITSVVTVPAVQSPELTEDGKISKRFIKMWKNKIRSVFRISLMNNHTKLILGAWGCGAYCNPPEHVATLFKEVLDESEFTGKFEEICFAILEDYNSYQEHNKSGNIKPFADIFGFKNK